MGCALRAWGSVDDPDLSDVVTFVRGLGGDAGVVAIPPAPPEPPQVPPLSEMELIIHPDGPPARLTLRDERFVPAAQVERELERGARMIIIDARATSDWLTLRIPGAIPVARRRDRRPKWTQTRMRMPGTPAGSGYLQCRGWW